MSRSYSADPHGTLWQIFPEGFKFFPDADGRVELPVVKKGIFRTFLGSGVEETLKLLIPNPDKPGTNRNSDETLYTRNSLQIPASRPFRPFFVRIQRHSTPFFLTILGFSIIHGQQIFCPASFEGARAALTERAEWPDIGDQPFPAPDLRGPSKVTHRKIPGKLELRARSSWP